MHIVSVNVGRRRRLEGRSFQGDTGIFKTPVEGAVMVGELGLEGDVFVDGRHHGGPDQAVYLYRQEDYDWWCGELGRELGAGTFGENLTVTGLPGPGLAIGCRLRFDKVLLEVTAPRIPCNTLATRMDDTGFAKRFMQAQRPGVYCRVPSAGALRTGERFELEAPAGPAVTTLELFRASKRRLDAAELRRFLAVPLDARTRADFESRLAKLSA